MSNKTPLACKVLLLILTFVLSPTTVLSGERASGAVEDLVLGYSNITFDASGTEIVLLFPDNRALALIYHNSYTPQYYDFMLERKTANSLREFFLDFYKARENDRCYRKYDYWDGERWVSKEKPPRPYNYEEVIQGHDMVSFLAFSNSAKCLQTKPEDQQLCSSKTTKGQGRWRLEFKLREYIEAKEIEAKTLPEYLEYGCNFPGKFSGNLGCMMRNNRHLKEGHAFELPQLGSCMCTHATCRSCNSCN